MLNRALALIYGTVVYGLFLLVFLYLAGFISNLLVPRSIDVGPQTPLSTAILVDLGLIALFGLQHSIMARRGFKQWWTKLVPKAVERSTFVLFTNIVLLTMYWQWRPITDIVWQVDSAWFAAILNGLFWAGFLLVLLTTFVIDHFELFGLKQVWLNFLERNVPPPNFQVNYFYRFVRHPLYLGFIVAFWSTPTMTLGHLIFAIGMSTHILIAIRFEERDLVHYLGDDYARYQKEVPMLVPRPGKMHAGTRKPTASH